MTEDNKTYLEVISYIKEGLKEGTLTVGKKLPTERVMAETLGMSRNSIREALRTLDNMGIIKCRQGSGNYLQGELGNGLSEALSMHLMMDMVTYREANSLRRAAEIESFERIIDYSLPYDKEYLEELLLKIESKDFNESADADREFHMAIMESGQNSLLICVVKAVMEACEEAIKYNLEAMGAEELQNTRKCHREEYHALLAGNVEAGKEAIRKHYQIVDESLRHIELNEEKYA